MDIVIGVLQSIIDVWQASWWIVLPTMLFFIAWDLWLMYARGTFIMGIQWKMLEIIIPKEILKTPKSMEQVFAALHAIYSPPPRFFDAYWKGKMQLWISLEMLGGTGGVHFYVRTPVDYIKLVESAIYAQYPEAEINEVEDYVTNLPSILPNEIYDLWGADFVLARDNAYPIKTYPYFEEIADERRLDPMAALTEVMSNLKHDESIWIQLLIRPINDDWKEKGEEVVDDLIGKKSKPKKSVFIKFIDGIALFIKNLVQAPLELPNWDKPEEERPREVSMGSLTFGKQDAIKSIEAKISKLGFDSNIRFIYIDRRDAFSRGNVSAVTGFFRQFNTQNLNAFKTNSSTSTLGVRGFFKKWKNFKRKRMIHGSYILRIFPYKTSILNIEELATIYHYPASFVIASQLRRIEAKRGSPPPNLPVE